MVTTAAGQPAPDVQRQIRQSIAAYSGSCPCPYSFDRAGRRCGARSAYSRPGGGGPTYYPSDVRQSRWVCRWATRREPLQPTS
jgi:hypothetical protein